MLLVDDAHGIGVVTMRRGAGAAHQQTRQASELLVVTFGKGFGVSGAAVLCSASRWPITWCSSPGT
ncbi:aminotransferase class I/II-fold pyridoxal phosphate-dependent enzyme [Klebsiella pneumoniae]|nr:aminotransferase class I/II-fold pyridoxal phosphate-dependent enzyme [Klebsiella pneumoniae]